MDRPRRMDGYVRVSRRKGKEALAYIRPDIQLERIQRWADDRGIEIVVWHFDDDGAAGPPRQPALRAALERVDRGETDGIACWRLDRFARTPSNARRDVERVRQAGGTLAFVEEGLDPTGPFRDFLLTTLTAVAALQPTTELRRRSMQQRVAQTVAKGRKVGGTPFGYTRAETGVLAPHPTEADIVREAFARAARDGLHACTAYLVEAAPHRGRRRSSAAS